MNYSELKEEIITLGFSDTDELEEMMDIVVAGINRAITEINLTVAPNLDYVEITKTDDVQTAYDMTELADDFLDFSSVPVMKVDGGYTSYNDFEIEMDRVIYLTLQGKYKIFYKKAHTPITADTTGTTKIELPLKAHILVPLLASYYIWQEDENQKAVAYYNQYEKLSQIIGPERPRATILQGGL